MTAEVDPEVRTSCRDVGMRGPSRRRLETRGSNRYRAPSGEGSREQPRREHASDDIALTEHEYRARARQAAHEPSRSMPHRCRATSFQRFEDPPADILDVLHDARTLSIARATGITACPVPLAQSSVTV